MEFKAFSVSQGEPHFLDCPVHVQFPRLPPHTNAPHTHTHTSSFSSEPISILHDSHSTAKQAA